MEKVGKMLQLGLLQLAFDGCPNSRKKLIIIIPVCLFLSITVGGNPLPKYAPTLTSPQDLSQDRLLAKPSQLTFKIGRCEADVSLEYIICRNLRKRGDLPKKQEYFDGFLQATFVNISGDGSDNIRLEDFKSLFPNLVSLTITESPGTAARLINLNNTGTSSQWKVTEALVPKSLLQDPHFAKRFNLNYFGSSSGGTGNKSFAHQKPLLRISDGGGSRGERALISGEETSSSTTTTESTSGKSFPQANHSNHISSVEEETNEINPDEPLSSDHDPEFQMDDGATFGGSGGGGQDKPQPPPESPQKLRRLVWPSIRILNLSSNELSSEVMPDFLGSMFPNLEELYLANNYLSTLDRIREADWTSLQKIDISGNPLDCTNLGWIDTARITLLQENDTLCDQPPHQNKAKPILKVLHLLKKLKEECRVNCSCDIAYIWEQNHVIHSKTVVNCSNKGFSDFPNPNDLPKPTDTLDLRNNMITSMSTFVDDQRYLDLNVMTLYLDDNQISSINILEGSDWFYQFQLFSIRRNHLTEVPVYVLENAFRQNSRLLQIDISGNKFKCDCFTVTSFKVWLLKYMNHIGHVEDVRCASTNEQIRYMRMEQWCTAENGPEFIDVLDIVSIVLAILIVVVVAKVYYDYWNFKTKGKLPWLVGKM